MGDIGFAWLEITGKCQLECRHCYAESGPSGSHGSMSGDDWRHAIDQLDALGVATVQFIGGEPTLHPEFAELVDHALRAGLQVEVYSNLVRVSDEMWSLFAREGVSLATSYYSDDPAEHADVTQRRTFERTRGNIAEAVRRGIPLRAGVVDMAPGQRSGPARDDLLSIGVRDVETDRIRGVGRGAAGLPPDVSQLCGHCASGVIAISPDGEVWPCVFSRWMPVGNVLDAELAEILSGPEAERVRAELSRQFESVPSAACIPKECDPRCPPSCSPSCRPAGNCRPSGNCSPNY